MVAISLAGLSGCAVEVLLIGSESTARVMPPRMIRLMGRG